MLKTKMLAHSYSKGQRFNFPDINCNSRETLLILGQSGVGKTTLLHILAGILKPSEGQVLINDNALYKFSGRKLDQFRGKNIGIIFQKPHFVQSISAIENLLLAQYMAGQKQDKNAAVAWLEKLNLEHRQNAFTYNMSIGEQQRLSIARSLINKPKIVLADEPTSALDDDNCKEVVNLLDAHADSVDAALIIVTHDSRLKDYFPNHIILRK